MTTEDPHKSKPLDHQVGGGHYKNYAIQPIDYILSNEIPFIEGNIIKYVTRWKDKGGVVDLRKAEHYLHILIAKTTTTDSAPSSIETWWHDDDLDRVILKSEVEKLLDRSLIDKGRDPTP